MSAMMTLAEIGAAIERRTGHINRVLGDLKACLIPPALRDEVDHRLRRLYYLAKAIGTEGTVPGELGPHVTGLRTVLVSIQQDANTAALGERLLKYCDEIARLAERV